MKVYLGKYKNFIGVYQLTEWLPEKIQHKICESKFGGKVSDFCLWVDKKRSRKVKIHIDKYDSWSADSTLALIAVPLLKQLRDAKHGSCITDDEDAPAEYAGEEMLHERWDWILDEIIWALTQCNEDWDSQFHTGYIDMVSIPIDADGNEVSEEEAEFFRHDTGPKDTSHFDKKGYDIYNERISEGLKLFGKYYRGLWD